MVITFKHFWKIISRPCSSVMFVDELNVLNVFDVALHPLSWTAVSIPDLNAWIQSLTHFLKIKVQKLWKKKKMKKQIKYFHCLKKKKSLHEESHTLTAPPEDAFGYSLNNSTNIHAKCKLFSISGILVTKQRSRLTDKATNALCI